MKRSYANWVYMQLTRTVCSTRIKMRILTITAHGWNHEKADFRVIINAFDAARKGSHKLLIRTVDTNILVQAIAYVESLGVQELWIALSTGTKV